MSADMGISDIINALINAVRFIYDLFKEIFQIVKQVVGFIKDVARILKRIFAPFLEIGQKVWKTIEKIVTTVWKTVRLGLERIVIDIKDLVEYLQFALTPLLIAASILDAFAKRAMVEAIKAGVKAVKEMYDVLALIGTVVGSVLNAVFLTFYNTLLLVGGTLNDIVVSITSWVDGVKSAIDDALGFLDDIRMGIERFIHFLVDKFQDLLGGFGNIFTTGGSSKPLASVPQSPVTFNIDMKDAVVGNTQSFIDDLFNEFTRRIGF